MKPHTFSDITIINVKKTAKKLIVTAVFNTFTIKGTHTVTIPKPIPNLDLRQKGERDFLCIEIERAIYCKRKTYTV
jgi:hypothetical protein